MVLRGDSEAADGVFGGVKGEMFGSGEDCDEDLVEVEGLDF